MGKLIYQPKGKAYEYCHWACNLYNGCSNLCTYCYNRKGLAHNRLGKDSPTLKTCVKDEDEAYELFQKELLKYKERILADGGELFFNFVSDPCLPETIELNFKCIAFAIKNGVKCRVLTKRIEVIDYVDRMLHKAPLGNAFREDILDNLIVGFTLTGCDELEPGASSNFARIYTLRNLRYRGIHIWASIEPVIDLARSVEMILQAYYYAGCREFKIGLLSGKKEYSPEDVREFKAKIENALSRGDGKVLWKNSVLKYIKSHSQLTWKPEGMSGLTI